MALPTAILSAIVSEEQQMASILSSEAVKASTTAAWISSITLSQLSAEGDTLNEVISKAVCVEKSVACVVGAAADKEISIAAKVGAVESNPVNINWKTTTTITGTDDCCC
jgi:hypothetical protein